MIASDVFAVAADGSFNAQPLAALKINFNPTTKTWRKAARFKRGGLPRIVARAEIARELEIDEQLLIDWERHVIQQNAGPSAEESLAVNEDGSVVNEDPLQRWKYRFHCESNVWRRATSHRNEVSRAEVARKVGICEDLIARWENARRSGVAKEQSAT